MYFSLMNKNKNTLFLKVIKYRSAKHLCKFDINSSLTNLDLFYFKPQKLSRSLLKSNPSKERCPINPNQTLINMNLYYQNPLTKHTLSD